MRGIIFELEMVCGKDIWEEGRGTRDEMEHMARAHPTVIEDSDKPWKTKWCRWEWHIGEPKLLNIADFAVLCSQSYFRI